PGLRSVNNTRLCQSHHCPLFRVYLPSLSTPPLASAQCPPPLSASLSAGRHLVSSTLFANPSAGFISVSSTPCPPFLSANPSTSLHSVSSTPLCNPSTGFCSVSSTPLCQ
ncbi:unnamed protein product, partial [Staurois parvus]